VRSEKEETKEAGGMEYGGDKDLIQISWEYP
jgi:hypothetical protein